MKKTYMAPTATRYALATEDAILTTSGKTIEIGGTITDPSEIRSNGKAWSSDSWTGADED